MVSLSVKAGRRIAELRAMANLSQEDLAERAKCSVGLIKKLEGGGTGSLASYAKIGTALGVDVDLMFSFVESKGAPAAPIVAADIIAHGFRAALDADPSEENWAEKLEEYGKSYMRDGATVIQERLAGDLIILHRQLNRNDLWCVAAKLMVLFGKTVPGSKGEAAVSWYRMAAIAADRSDDLDTRIWVRGRASLAFGYEGASLPLAQKFGEDALAMSDKLTIGRLNALMGLAHAVCIQGDIKRARRLLEESHRVFDKVGSDEQDSDYAVPEWRYLVHLSLSFARLGLTRDAINCQDIARKLIPAELLRFQTHLELHTGLMLARAGDRAAGKNYAVKALDRLPEEKHSLSLKLLFEEI